MNDHTTRQFPEVNIEYGHCHCGCGQKTNVPTRTTGTAIKGQPRLFLHGHYKRGVGIGPRPLFVELISPPGTRAIQLTQGKVAIVDDADYEWLSQWLWFAHWGGWKWYAERKRAPLPDGERTGIYMHAEILAVGPGVKVDHRDGDGLNNTRGNLRPATHQENACNRAAHSNNTSGFKGVSWRKVSDNWVAQIQINGIKKHLGLFDAIEDAARAYDDAAKELHGEFARLNFPVMHELIVKSKHNG